MLAALLHYGVPEMVPCDWLTSSVYNTIQDTTNKQV